MKKQIKLIGIIFVFCLVFSLLTLSSVAKAPGEDKIEWEYVSYGNGVMLTKYVGDAVDVYIPSSLTVDGVDYPVVKLGDGLFENNDAINSVTLGQGIDEIGARAFYDCDNLVCVLINEDLEKIGNEAFYSCDAFNSFILYKSVKSIGANIFGDCPGVVVWCSVGTTGYDYVIANGIKFELLDTSIGTPETFVIDGLTYYVQEGAAYLIDSEDGLTDVIVPATVKGYPVVGIYGAFRDNYNLTKVTLPEGIKFIGEYAFYNCYNLAEVNFPESLTEIGERAFYYCSNLAEVNFPESLTEIGKHAFYSCNALREITIPGSVNTIGDSAFSNCHGMENLTIKNGVKNVSGYAFNNCDNLREIFVAGSVRFDYYNYGIFASCDSLEKVTFESGITCISSEMFQNCTNLKSVSIPNTVTDIAYQAFDQCLSLKTVLIPESVKNIDSRGVFYISTILIVFEDSYAHQYAEDNNRLYAIYDGVNMPEAYTENGLEYFIANGEAYVIGCDKTFSTVNVPAEIKGVPVVGIYGAFRDNGNVTKVTLPEGIKFIGEYAFYNCYNLAEVNFPESLTEIGERAFYYCSNLAEVNFPESLTEIGKHAFYSCNALREITIPGSVNTIGDSAFSNCHGMENLTIKNGVKNVSGYAFNNCDNLREIFVAGSVRFDYYNYGIFASCDSLEKVTFESGITCISSEMFQNCTNLKSVSIPNTVTDIAYQAFDQCLSLKTVLIPESVKNIDSRGVFYVSTILVVFEDSYAHQYAERNNNLYFLVRMVKNPEISYGMSINGTVKDTDGIMREGVTVEIFYEDGTLKESVKTDAEGKYNFTYAEVGKYTIKASDDDGNVYTTNIAVKRLNVFSVYVSGSCDLVLKASYTVSGNVSKWPAEVVLKDTAGKVIDKMTSTDGSFSFTKVPNGTYIISATTENGYGAIEVTVYRSNITDLYIEIKDITSSIWGYAVVENRDGTTSPKAWIDVKIYDSEGNVVATAKTDANGRYEITNLPAEEYNITATTTEIRPDKVYGYNRVHELYGYGHIDASNPAVHQVETIILREKDEGRATISGKVTANSEPQICDVTISDSQGNEIARMTTKNNGKFSFVNLTDGVYIVSAVTKSGNAGSTTVSIIDGIVSGDTHIKIAKADKVSQIEANFFADVPELQNKEEAEQYRDRISEEKNTYDGLSKKEKKQLSEEYVERLNKYVEWLAECEVTAPEGVTVEQGGLVISSDEIANGDNVSFNLGVEATDAWVQNPDGVNSVEDQLCIAVQDVAGSKDIVQYYEITMSKTVNGVTTSLTDVYKDTDAMGKFRITLPIPEEFRGYNNYSIIHVHEGNIYTLADLDNDPNTITIEVDKFSTFVLLGNTEEIAHECDYDVTTTLTGCTTAGERHYTCSSCGDSYSESIDPVGHKWDSKDHKTCTVCGATNDAPDTDNCGHLCHRGGLYSIIWNIFKYIYELFNIETVCECGKPH